MNEDIMRQAGFGDGVDRRNAGLCPICGKGVLLEQFRDALSRKEFGISGWCQACQDSFFEPQGGHDDSDE